MTPRDPASIEAFLKGTKLNDCLAWFEQSRDEEVLAALRPLLFDQESGSVRVVSDQTLRGELLSLAKTDDAFRHFVADQFTRALDRITAEYLEQHLNSP